MAMPAASYAMNRNFMPSAEEQSFSGKRKSKAYFGGGESGY
jgi:hypothetical protein